MSRRHQSVGLVANSEKQSVDVCFRMVRQILENTPHSAALIKSGAIVVNADRIEFAALKNWIQGYSNSTASLYGKSLSVAQCSELHAAKTDGTYQVLASSTIDNDDGLILVDSTTGPMSSPLYQLYKLAESGEDDEIYFSHLFYRDLEDAIARGPSWIKAGKLRSRARQMLPHEFAQQHLNTWTASSANLFPANVIERCYAEAFPLDVKAITGGAAYVVGAGLDRAYGFSLHGDSTVTTCVLKTTGPDGEAHFYVLASDDIRFSSEGGIKAALTRYHRDFGPVRRAALESYNAADIAAWAADQPFASELIHPTAERQSSAFTALFQAANESRLHIHPSMAKLKKELGTFEYKLDTGTNGTTVAKFGHAKGCHDDTVYSLCWAVYALRDDELNPFEIEGVHCHNAPNGAIARLCVLNAGDIVPMCAGECRSMIHARDLYERYKERAGIAPMIFVDFFKAKVVNTGSHSVPR